jgi:FKBP-type peptidyl-prolyl cis-trans isomerase FkpA
MHRFTRRVTALAVALALPLTGAAQKLDTEEQKTLYAIGLALSQNLQAFALNKDELELVKAGLADGVMLKGTPKVKVDEYIPKIQALQQARAKVAADAEKKSSATFLEKAAKEKGATKTSAGFIISTVKAGTGASPKVSDQVKVHYHGTLTDGTVFDSSVQRGEPATFPLNGVIPCWTQGVQMMKVGGKAKLVCPSDLAYGDRGAPPKIKPGATLVFDVELLEIVK